MILSILRSKIADRIFFASTVFFVAMVALVFIAVIPPVNAFLLSFNPVPDTVAYIWGAVLICFMLAMVVLCTGMAINAVFQPNRSIGSKIAWLFLFFLTAPLSSALYYTVVYRKQIGKS